MSDNLIAEARKACEAQYFKGTYQAQLMERLADALEARQPSGDDRETIAKALCEGAGGEWSDLDEQERAWHYRDADSVLAAGFSRAAAPDGQVIIPIARIHELRAAKDAALAAIERVAALASRAQTFGADEFGAFKRELLAALDGAPEPEVKP